MGGSTGSGSTTTPFASPSFTTNTITSNDQSVPSAMGDAFAMQALNSNIGQQSPTPYNSQQASQDIAQAANLGFGQSQTGASKPGGTQSPSANGQINQGSTPTFGQPSSPTTASKPGGTQSPSTFQPASKPGGAQSSSTFQTSGVPQYNDALSSGQPAGFGQPSSPTLGSGTLSSSGGSTPPFGQPAAPMTPDPSGMTVNQTSSSPMVAGAPAQNGVAGTASTYQPPASLPFNPNWALSSMGNFSSMLGQGNSYGNNNPFGSGASSSPLGSSGSGSNPSPLNSGSSKPGGGQSGGFGG